MKKFEESLIYFNSLVKNGAKINTALKKILPNLKVNEKHVIYIVRHMEDNYFTRLLMESTKEEVKSLKLIRNGTYPLED